MKQIAMLSLVLLLLLSGCTGPSDSDTLSQADTKKNQMESDLPEVTGLSKQFDIEFSYINKVYQYDLQAKWSDVEIKAETTPYESGIEVLLDGTTEMFSECDLNHSDTITQDEWSDYDEDIDFNTLDLNSDSQVNLKEFEHFTGQLNGVFLSPSWHAISQPGQEDYAISIDEFDPPVSLKILRAGEGGFNAGAGVVFPEGTIFIELVSEFDVVLKAMPDFELGPGFEMPLLSMYLEEDYEENNHGALGFSSVVNTKKFNAIYGGKPFSLHYEGKGESGVLDKYDLTITPRN
ncbi:EF-hand domain-containing protein [Anaerovorax odorimutans]|uniref:EF-hand domain-containing protein n=1 Tax=Anaerovorax odorimutans TaxID=109327 RepID=UPI000410A532|nr:EF-hand domain-containing protein [Anaerovorax odorimutans]